MTKAKTENSQVEQSPIKYKSSLKVLALGGLNELGKNMWVFEAESTNGDSEYVIVDAGVLYPGYEQPGIDYVFPDLKYIQERKDKVHCLALTSVHETHCGSAVQLIQKCGIKRVLGSKLALALVRARLDESLAKAIEWVDFKSREEIKLGEFNLIPFRLTSSADESYALAVEAKGKKVFYTGTYKIDQTLLNRGKTDLSAITAYSTPGVGENEEPVIDLYIGDSANAEVEGYSASEMTVISPLRSLLKSEKGRVLFNTYKANTIRLQNLFDLAAELGRKIVLIGKDSKDIYKATIETGLLEHAEGAVISPRDMANYPDNEILALTMAAEGQALEELVAIAGDKHLEFQIKEGDTVLNSGDPPPGTIRVMAQVCDALFLKGANILGGKKAGIHVESHALTEEMKFMFNLIRPRYFVPAMGETRQLVRHAKLATDVGFHPAAIFILDNGDVLQLNESSKEIEIAGKIPTGEILFNDLQDFDIDDKIIRDREILSKEGVVIVAFTLDKKKNVIAGPAFSARAATFSKNKEWRAFCLMNTTDILDGIKQLSLDKPNANMDVYQTFVREHMNKIIKQQIGKKPSVIVFANQI